MIRTKRSDGTSRTVRVPVDQQRTSTKNYRKSQSRFAGFLVLAVHVLGGLGQGLHGRVEIDAVSGRDLVARDGIGRPCLYRTECAALNTWDLHVPGYRVTRHAQVML